MALSATLVVAGVTVALADEQAVGTTADPDRCTSSVSLGALSLAAGDMPQASSARATDSVAAQKAEANAPQAGGLTATIDHDPEPADGQPPDRATEGDRLAR